MQPSHHPSGLSAATVLESPSPGILTTPDDLCGHSAADCPDHALPPPPALTIERNGYLVRIANGCDPLQRQTAALVERMYAARGLIPYGVHVTPPDGRDLIVAALRNGHAAATLTLRMDCGAGLLADALYHDEIDAVRQRGARVSEITRLAIAPDAASYDALAGLLQALYTLAQLTGHMSDIFIEVHPRHARFHQRVFGFRLAGEERICPRVGAPAVLLHLSRQAFEAALAGRGPSRMPLRARRARRVDRLLPSEEEFRKFRQLLNPSPAG